MEFVYIMCFFEFLVNAKFTVWFPLWCLNGLMFTN